MDARTQLGGSLDMRGIRVLLVAVALFATTLVIASCDCVDQTGNRYLCTCQKRCQGVDSTFTTTTGCMMTNPGGAVGECISSCSPEATCTGCSCSKGPECTIPAKECNR